MIKRLSFAAFALMGAVIFFSKLALADDVYNFYFQKFPPGVSANSVTPGATNQLVPVPAGAPAPAGSQQPTPAPAGATSTAPVPPNAANEDIFKHFHIDLGYALLNQLDGNLQAGVLGFGYDFNQYIGLNTDFLFAQRYSPGSSFGTGTSSDHVDWALGAAFMPLRLRAFEKDFMHIGITGGILQTRQPSLEFNSDNCYGSCVSAGEYRDAIKPYLGAKVAVNFSNTIGVAIEDRVFSSTANAGDGSDFSSSTYFSHLSFEVVVRL